MARLVVNGEDFSSQLTRFTLQCNECGSEKVALDIDWAAYPSCSWCTISVICEFCHHEEIITSS
jgi:hypothetical protein